MTRYRFVPPPGWPPSAAGSAPLPGWVPDDTWPPPPIGWPFWLAVGDDEPGVDDPQWRFRPRPVDGRRHALVSLVMAVASLVLLVGGAVWTVVTSALGRPILGTGELTIFFVPFFPIFGWAVWTLQRLATRLRTKRNPRPFARADEMVGSLGRWGKAVVAVGVLAALTSLVTATATRTLIPSGGQPERVGSRYALDNHGSVRFVSRAVYGHAAISSIHFATLVGAVFLLVALPVNLNRWTRWRRLAPTLDAGLLTSTAR